MIPPCWDAEGGISNHGWGRRGWLRTALLDALNGSAGNGPVNGLCGVLDGLDGALAGNRCGGEQACLASDLLTEHGDGDVDLCGVEKGLCVRCCSEIDN